jgi:hypothetical protein
MTYKNPAEDAAAELLERRWFAAFRAASNARSECEALLDQMEALEAAWCSARSRLAESEMLRDSLGEELMQLESRHAPAHEAGSYRPAVSAA